MQDGGYGVDFEVDLGAQSRVGVDEEGAKEPAPDDVLVDQVVAVGAGEGLRVADDGCVDGRDAALKSPQNRPPQPSRRTLTCAGA